MSIKQQITAQMMEAMMRGKAAKATQENEDEPLEVEDLTGGGDAGDGDGFTVVHKGKGKQKDAMKPKGGTARGRAEVNSDTIVEDRSQAPKRPGGDIDDSERAGRDEKP